MSATCYAGGLVVGAVAPACLGCPPTPLDVQPGIYHSVPPHTTPEFALGTNDIQVEVHDDFLVIEFDDGAGVTQVTYRIVLD